MQTIHYEGEATLAADVVLNHLVNDALYSPGDWFVEVHLTPEDWSEPDPERRTVRGDAIAFEMTEHGGLVTIHPKDPDTMTFTGEPEQIPTEQIETLVIP